MKNFDGMCRHVTGQNFNALIPWFLMACYAYEILGEPILSDACFDEMSESMNMLFDVLEHPHKDLITWTADQVKGSSVQVDWGRFPSRIGYAVQHLTREH